MANKELGVKLAQLRKIAGYTQKNAAAALGVNSPNTLAAWEQGMSEPDNMTFIRLCRLYNLNDFSCFEERQETDQRERDADMFTIDEKQLIQLYRKLNQEGRELLCDTADTLVKSKKYKKRDSLRMA